MYVPWFPCPDCARGIVQAGICRLSAGKPDFYLQAGGEDPWGFRVSETMLLEGGVELDLWDRDRFKLLIHELGSVEWTLPGF